MGEANSSAAGGWGLRSVPGDVSRRYRAAGHWTDATLGEMVADGLASMGRVEFRVHSAEPTVDRHVLGGRPGGAFAGGSPSGPGRGPG